MTWIHWDEREHAQEPLGQSQGPSVSMGARHGRRSSRLRQRSQTTHWLAEEPQTLNSRLEVSFKAETLAGISFPGAAEIRVKFGHSAFMRKTGENEQAFRRESYTQNG